MVRHKATATDWRNLPGYFETVEWKELYDAIQKENPLIFFFIKTGGRIEEVIIRRGAERIEVKKLINRGRPIPTRPITDPVILPSDLQAFIDSSPKKAPVVVPDVKIEPILPIPEELEPGFEDLSVKPGIPENKPDLSPSPSSNEAEKTASPVELQVKLDPDPQPSEGEGEVAVGRWVEFKDGNSIKTGKINWISSDEQEFLIKPKEGSATVVNQSSLISLVPNLD